MNIKKLAKSLVFSMILFGLSGLAMANGGFPARISAQLSEVTEAQSANQIDKDEARALKQELQGIKGLFTQYYTDKKLTAEEFGELDAKLKQAVVNLFRSKYD